MPKYKVKEIKDKGIWEGYVLTKNPQSFLQSWNWGETNSLLGKKIYRLGFYYKEKLEGVCLLVKEKAKRGNYMVIPGGPMIDWSKSSLIRFFIKEIKKIAKHEKVWFLRVRPELPDTKNNRLMFKKSGFLSAPMHLHAENTWVLNISPPEDVILSGMRKNTRYLIRKSLNIGLKLKSSSDPKDVKILTKLQEETAKRHGFVGFSEELFNKQLETFGRDSQAKLYFCTKGEKVLVSAIIIFYGNYAYYHHGASSEASREIPASYFLQWEIIKDAKNNGKSFYNFWGIAPEGVNKHRFSGVTTFKTGFGGKRVNWLHAHDLPTSRFYILTYILESLRRKIRGL